MSQDSRRPHEPVTAVHRVHSVVHADLWTPAHPPRRPTATYRATHKRLIVEHDRPCLWCDVRRSDLATDAGRRTERNPRAARVMELHHHPVERSLIHCCDWRKLAAVFPAVDSQGAMLRWIDTEDATMVLCDVCHRGPFGIHHLGAVTASVRPFVLGGYMLAVGESPQWEEAIDTQCVQEAGLEPEPGEPA
jgi:hypothetical protein